MSETNDNGLQKRLSDGTKAVPRYSGPLGVSAIQVDAADFPLSKDGVRVLCASISMVAGSNTWAANPDQRFVLWQGSANINNAVSEQVGESIGNGISSTQAAGLCGLAKAAYSFTNRLYRQVPNGVDDTFVTAPVPSTGPGSLTAAEVDLSCITKFSTACVTVRPNWVNSPTPYLAKFHILTVPGYCT
jgi:hypothetical protein